MRNATMFIHESIPVIAEDEKVPVGHLPFIHGEIILTNNREALIACKIDDADNIYLYKFFIVKPSSKERDPNYDYKICYHSMKEVLTSTIEEKAMLFAHNNPSIVYGEGTEECQAVSDGFLSPYFSIKRSISEG